MDLTNLIPMQNERGGIEPDELLGLAESAGLADADQSALLAFALAVAEQCAEIGDGYTSENGNCGEAIRTYFGLG